VESAVVPGPVQAQVPVPAALPAPAMEPVRRALHRVDQRRHEVAQN